MRKPTGDNTLAGYVRQSSADIIPTATLRAAPINAEYNKLRDAFAVSSGHKHDGSIGEGGYIPLIGDVDALNKVSINTSTNQIGVFVEVSNAAVEQLRFSDGAIIPVITNDIDLGTSGLEFKDLYLDGTAHIDTLDVDINGAVAGTFTIGSTLGVTGTTTLSTANITTGVITSVDINSGAIDNVTIGGTTAGAGSFTTLSATGTSTLSTVDINAGAIDGTTIGASSAAPATVTDLTSTGTATLATVDINAGNIDNTVIGASTAVAGSFTTVSTSGQATLATVDINGGNIDGTIIGASATAAITGTTITGSSLVGPLTGNVTGNITGNVTGNLTGNVTGNVTAGSGLSTFNNVTVNGTLDVTGTTIANVTDPTNAQDAATKNYVDTEVSALVDSSPSALNTLNELAAAINDDASFSTTITNSIATKLPLAGGTMSGAIAMGTSKITGLGDPTANQDGATKNYVDTTALLKSGGTMASAIAMGNNKITGLGTPTANTDAATKTYVDSIAGSNTAAAASATQAATSATNAATSATNSANSATSAATSATNAANSYDSFDDRYLGAKSSAPSVDNDGDALIAGALYFNTTSNIMFVRSGAGWQAAGSSVNGTSGRNTYTATAGQTTFSATYDVGYVDVYLNGVKLLVGTDVTATSGSTVVLATGATVGDIIDIVGYGTFQLADHYSKTAADARFLGLAGGTMTGDINGNGNKVLFGNVYSQLSDLPSASTYHGMFAHVHATGKGYFAHAGNWIPLANDTEKLNLSGGTMTGNLDVGGSVEFDSLSGTGAVSITNILDEDNMASNSATALATQQSIKAYTDTAVANLVDSSPGSLDTLNELAAALGDDASFSTTITNSIATKLPLAGGTLTGNLDVGGTVTADGLTVDLPNATDVNIDGTDGGGIQFKNSGAEQFRLDSASNDGALYHTPSGKNHTFKTDGVNRLKIATGGDISFYNSAGSAAKFFWDSSTERLGLGTSSPSRQLDIYDDGTVGQAVLALTAQNTDYSRIMFADPDDSNIGILDYAHADNSMRFSVNNAERMRLDSSGNVVIGANPSTSLGAGDNTAYIGADGEIQIRRAAGTGRNMMKFRNGSNHVGSITTDADKVSLLSLSGDLTLDASGDITLDADGGDIRLKDNGTQFGVLYKDSNDFSIFSAISDGDIKLQGLDGSSVVTALTLDMSEGGRAIFNHDILLSDNRVARFGNQSGGDLKIYHDGDNSFIKDAGTGRLTISTNELAITNSSDSESMIRAYENNQVELYYDNSKKFETTSSGVTVTGTINGGDLRGEAWLIGRDSNDHIGVNTNEINFVLDGNVDMRLENDGDLHVDGNVIAYSTTISDERLKKDIVKIDNALDKVSQLNGYTFEYLADGKKSAGVIAQEVEKVMPSAITESTLPLKMGEDDKTEYKTVQYDQLHGLMIEAIKELKAEIEELKAR